MAHESGLKREVQFCNHENLIVGRCRLKTKVENSSLISVLAGLSLIVVTCKDCSLKREVEL